MGKRDLQNIWPQEEVGLQRGRIYHYLVVLSSIFHALIRRLR